MLTSICGGWVTVKQRILAVGSEAMLTFFWVAGSQWSAKLYTPMVSSVLGQVTY